MINLKKILGEDVEYQSLSESFECVGICHDHRLLRPGEIFIALQGEKRHEVEFAQQAIQAGASAILTSRDQKDKIDCPAIFVNDPMLALKKIAQAKREAYEGALVAVTGTCGKTSFKELFTALYPQGKCFSSYGNWNNQLGLMINLSRLDNTYPVAIFELGISQIGDMQSLVDVLLPTYAVLTSLGPAHLEGLGTMETLVEEKSKIKLYSKTAYCSSQAATLLKNVTEWTVVFPENLLVDQNKQHLTFIQEGKTLLERDLIAPFRWHPQLLSLALQVCLDLNQKKSMPQVVNPIVVPVTYGRGECLLIGSWRLLDETYNSNPLSLSDLISFLNQHHQGSILIFGDMAELGDYEAYYQKQIANLIHHSGNIDAVYIGAQVQRWIELGVSSYLPTEIDKVIEFIHAHGPSCIALKASRSQGFERWVQILKEELESVSSIVK